MARTSVRSGKLDGRDGEQIDGKRDEEDIDWLGDWFCFQPHVIMSWGQSRIPLDMTHTTKPLVRHRLRR